MLRNFGILFFLFTISLSFVLGNSVGMPNRDIDAPQIFFVKENARGSGTSFEDALGNLQHALEMAKSGDQIWIVEGTYFPTEGEDRDESFVIPNGVQLYGGFTGRESSIEDRQPTFHPTVLSGDIGNRKEVEDNSFTVVVTIDVDRSCIIDGLVIADGRADTYSAKNKLSRCGGGWYNSSANVKSGPRIRNCIFRNNYAIEGGAMYNDALSGLCQPSLESCLFDSNEALEGGAVYNNGEKGKCQAIFMGCTFEKNEAFSGPVMLNYGGDRAIWDSRKQSTFTGNISLEGRGVIRNISPTKKKTTRSDYALFVATDEYKAWTNLQNPVRDAEAIGHELKERYGFETEVLSNPTQVAIFKKLREYSKKKYQEEDQLLLFFAGHGYYDEQLTEGFLIPHDGAPFSDAQEGISWVAHSRLREIIASIPCKHILVIIDACSSGTFDRRISLGRGTPKWEASLNNFLKYKSRLYITSAAKEYVSDGTDHSPFARNMLTTLRSYSNAFLTYTQIIAGFNSVNTSPRFGEFEGNEPGGTFLFIAPDAKLPVLGSKFSRPLKK